MRLQDIDLNLLHVFACLAERGQVSRVAEDLGLTQPAVSNALARLRRTLGDPLFVRTPAGMAPTPAAQRLLGPVREALALVHGALNEPHGFVPATSTRQFTLGMSDVGEIYFLPTLMQRLAAAAPQVSLSTVRPTAVDLKVALQAGQVDMAVGLLPQLRGGFHQRRLFSQRYVCLFRQGHPWAGRRIGVAAYAQAEHLAVAAPGTGHGQVDAALARRGVRRRVRLAVPHFVAIGHILASTDLVATVPERLASRIAAPFGLASTALPVTLPETAISLYWHATRQRDEALQWLRRELVEAFADP